MTPTQIESEFIAATEKLAAGYDAISLDYAERSKNLRSFVAKLRPTFQGQQELAVVHSNGASTSGDLPPPPTVSPNGSVPRKVSDMIRTVIQMKPERVTASEVQGMICLLFPGVKSRIKPGRISSGLWQLVQDGELEPIEKSPGKPSTYRATPKFRPSIKFRRELGRETSNA